MKFRAFAMIGAAALAVSACSSGNQDQVDENAVNADTTNLDALANDAANDAEAEALGNQADQLANEANALDNAADNLGSTSEADTPVNGM